jgi:hypothetical protein
MPDRGRFLLFTPNMRGTERTFPNDLIQQRLLKNLRAAIHILLFLQRRSAELLASEPGEHPNSRVVNQWVAEQARDLLRRHNKHVENSTAESLLRVVASLLFEAVSGRKNKDLEAACKIALYG